MTESDQGVTAWLAGLSNRDNPYAGGAVYDVLCGMMVLRLDGQSVRVTLPVTEAFGVIEPLDPFLFELSSVAAQGGAVGQRFKTATGARGMWQFVLATRTLSMMALDDKANIEQGDYLTFNIREILAHDVTRAGVLHFETDVTFDVSTEDWTPSSIDLELIRRRVFDRMNGQIPTSGRLPIRYVSGLTGVLPSTLSNVKNGRSDLLNLPASTLVPLSVLARLIAYDDRLVQVGSVERAGRLVYYDVVIRTTIGVYHVKRLDRVVAFALHDELTTVFDDAARTITFRDILREDHSPVARLTLDKRDVESIEMIAEVSV